MTREAAPVLPSMVEHAVLAPSSHNTQPWTFRLGDDRFELYVDRSRALPVNDPHDRELIISCGAALLNARVAAARAEVGLEVTVLPEDGPGGLLARATVSGVATPDEPLFAAIAARRTYRKPFADRDVLDGIASRLSAAAAEEGARLEVLGLEQRSKLVSLVSEGVRAQFADPSWRGELASWMRPRRKGDGLVYSPLTRLVVRHFDVGRRTAARDSRLAAASPVLAVLATDGDGVADWLRAGQALQRLLLTATAAGLHGSYLNQPIQVERLRPRVAELLGAGSFPQVGLRLGYPPKKLRAAPRRPLAAVVSAG